MGNIFDVIIVGAGQAGISVSYHLKQQGIQNHLMIEENNNIGDSWRTRYDSLVLFTPKSYSSLPGLEMVGAPDSYPTKDEMADYLANYVEHYSLPYKLNTYVVKITKENQYFTVYTSTEKLQTRNVVIASGAFRREYIPPVIDNEKAISHIHSSNYKEPKQLERGVTLVVGGGNSGAQIAVELSQSREVYLAVSQKLTYLPLRLFGKSIFKWLDQLQLLYAGTDTIRGKMFQKRKDPIFGKELKVAIKKGRIKLKPRVINVDNHQVNFSDGSSINVNQIIWSTGFIPSYEMIKIEGAVNEKGFPIHKRGISPIEGLYYAGLPWQHSRGSALVCGVARDAKYIVNAMFSKER